MSGLRIAIPAIRENATVRLGAYVAFVKAAKAAPDAEFKHGLTCWWPVTGADGDGWIAADFLVLA